MEAAESNGANPGRQSRKHRAPQYVDGPALRHALWHRIRGRLLLATLGLGVLGSAIFGPGLIGFPHVVLVVLSIPVLTMALVGLPHLFRDPLVRKVVVRPGGVSSDHIGDCAITPAVSAKEFRTTFAVAVGVAFSDGNGVDVLANGEGTFERLWSDLRVAQRSITVQMYYAGPGIVADTTIDILAERARSGVEVYFLYDAFGAEDLPETYIHSLREAGVHTAAYRPVRWYNLDNASHRLHVRGLVIDGHIAYTGGFGIDDKWLGNGRLPGEWRETNVRFRGPSVGQLQAGFVAEWSTATGELLVGDFLFDVADASVATTGVTNRETPSAMTSVSSESRDSDRFVSAGAASCAVVRSPPLMGSTAAERLVALAIYSARQTLFISNAYFVPTAAFTRLLLDAARRGVDVRVLTNGRSSDVRTTWLAGRRSYELLLRGGVRIYEYSTTIHAKTFVVDSRLTAIGTINFDNRSLAYNNEVALVTLDAATGKLMDSLFIDDIGYSDEIIAAAFRTRGWTSRLMESVASIASRLL